MQLGLGIHQQPLPGEAREGAKTLAACVVADADRQQGDARSLQLGQGTGQGLGVFEAVEIAQLGQQHHQPPPALAHALHRSESVQQGRRGQGRPSRGRALSAIAFSDSLLSDSLLSEILVGGIPVGGGGHGQGGTQGATRVARLRKASAAAVKAWRRAGSIRSSRCTIIERRGLA